MELTTLDKELLGGLQVLTDQEIGRVQAHLAAGLPMQTGHTGYIGGSNEPSTNGCLIGVSMPPRKAYAHVATFSLAMSFDYWVATLGRAVSFGSSVPPATLDRLAALLDMEWSRRHPVMPMSNPVEQSHDTAAPSTLPAESRHDAIIPSLEAVAV